MSNDTPNNPPKQLSFADIPQDDLRPLPLIVADKWDFPLQYHDVEDKTYFAISDWIIGLIGCSSSYSTVVWTNFKKTDLYKTSQLQSWALQLKYQSSDGKSYNRNFANDETLYLLVQYLRSSDDRPMLDEIRQFLAISGATLDDWRRNPEKFISAAEAKRLEILERHDKAGLGDRPEIIHLKSEHEIKRSIKELNSVIQSLIDNPDFAKLHDTKYVSLFGETASNLKKMLDTKDIHKSLPTLQLDTLDFTHKQIMQVLRLQGKISNDEAMKSIAMVVEPLGVYLRGLCANLGIHHVTGKPLLGSGQ